MRLVTRRRIVRLGGMAFAAVRQHLGTSVAPPRSDSCVALAFTLASLQLASTRARRDQLSLDGRRRPLRRALRGVPARGKPSMLDMTIYSLRGGERRRRGLVNALSRRCFPSERLAKDPASCDSSPIPSAVAERQ